jgi:hypothetical protein
MSVDDDASPLDELIGQQLSAVAFVQDYVQLWFDGVLSASVRESA